MLIVDVATGLQKVFLLIGELVDGDLPIAALLIFGMPRDGEWKAVDDELVVKSDGRVEDDYTVDCQRVDDIGDIEVQNGEERVGGGDNDIECSGSRSSSDDPFIPIYGRDELLPIGFLVGSSEGNLFVAVLSQEGEKDRYVFVMQVDVEIRGLEDSVREEQQDRRPADDSVAIPHRLEERTKVDEVLEERVYPVTDDRGSKSTELVVHRAEFDELLHAHRLEHGKDSVDR